MRAPLVLGMPRISTRSAVPPVTSTKNSPILRPNVAVVGEDEGLR